MNIPERDLPLFPLNTVLFPRMPLPLHIFEPRYREMLKYVMARDKMFGVVNIDTMTRRPAEVGCAAEIIEVEKLPDGRSNLLTIGQNRFRIVETRTDMPFLMGQVEWIKDEDHEDDLHELAEETRSLLKSLMTVSARLVDKPDEFPDDEVPTEPTALSFWLAAQFPGVPDERQLFLEMRQTGARLKRESHILNQLLKEMTVRKMIKDAVG